MKRSVDVLYHDLDERPGSKFATTDLIGIPWQIMVGPKGLAEGKIELKRRADGSRELVTPTEAVVRLTREPSDLATNLCAALPDIAILGGMKPPRIGWNPGWGKQSSMSEPTGTRPFAPFEWMLSLRYLRARRKEGFISVIAGFSFLGIMLGVATLIIVMAVMNGFRKELLDKILGLNGHLLIQPLDSPLTDFDQVAERVSKVPGIRLAAPIVEGQALASSPFSASGVLVRGIRAADLGKLRLDRQQHQAGYARRLRPGAGRRDRQAPRRSALVATPATTSRWSRRAAR